MSDPCVSFSTVKKYTDKRFSLENTMPGRVRTSIAVMLKNAF